MKKILGFALQCMILITLGYSFLNSRLLLVADWLSPVLSNKVYSFFTLFFLVLGDPRHFPELIIIWGTSAILLGIIIRKPVASVISCISTWIFIISLTGVIAFGMVAEANNNIVFTDGMDLFEALPPFPPDLTIASLTETPIIGELIDFSLDMANSEPERLEPSLIIGQLGELYTVSLISKPVIASVFSLLGVFIGKKVEHILDPTITEKRLMLKKR